MLARHPALAQAFNTFNGHILFATTLSPRQREMLVLRVAAVREAIYEWKQHVVLAADAGLTPEEVARIEEGPGATWGVLAAALDVEQLMDLVFTVGAYDALAMAFRSFAIPLDDDLR